MNVTKTRNGSALTLLSLLFAACGGGSGASSVSGVSGDFVLLRVTPPDNSSLYLNDAIQFDFSTPIDISSADLNSVSFNVFDLTGRPLGEQPRGTFRVVAAPGDDPASPGRRLEFVPPLPFDDLFLTGGFLPARRYVVQLVGGDRRNGVVLRDVRGRELQSPISFSFTTVDGVTAAELFRNTKQGGPRRAGFAVEPSILLPNGQRSVSPSFNASVPLEVLLTFDQAVNPQSVNVPARVDLDPRTRDAGRRGRVFLEYDDPSRGGEDTWIPAEVELRRNDLEGAEIILRPIGALPTNATIDVRVLNTFEDVAGESNVADAAYTSLFGQFVVEARHEPQFDALVERFEGMGAVDLDTPFLEPVAEVSDGGVTASLAFEGEDATVDYEPTTTDTILNTDFTRVTLRSGRSINVSGGVFQFRDVRIPPGYTVTGQGSNPMVWLVTGDMTIEGTLRCDGSDGEAVSSTSAETPAAGGPGQGGGGRGGRGSVSTTGRTDRAETGYGAGNITGEGGEGGQHSCQASSLNNCRIGSGGGGGSFATKGDPDFYTLFQRFRGAGLGEFDMRGGDGRVGCQNKSTGVPGIGPGTAGPLGFLDADENNNFLGHAIRFTPTGLPNSRLAGELFAARGGAGGGGGGDGATDCANLTNWRTDAKGGGGGGGAGALIIKCLGRVRILRNGKITAIGGSGGGGFPNGTSAAGTTTSAGAGGGGGSGGMVLVMCSALDIVRHGDAANATYGDATTTTRTLGAYDFAIMADGGVGKRNPQPGLLAIRGKYPTAFLSGESPETATQWHADIGDRPVGGFGGNGVIQLMTPSLGDADNTGSFFDDSIYFYASDEDLNASPKRPLSATIKKTLLGWRGYRNEGGGRVDDKNATITLGANGFNIGDIKPAPVLLPAPFGPLSRVVSQPIDLGRVDRIESNVAQGVRTIVPRGTAAGDPFTNLLAGPTFLFGGNESPSNSTYQGYLKFDSNGAQVDSLIAGSNSRVTAILADATFNGRAAYRIELAAANAVLAQIPGRYTGYQAQLLASGSLVAELRVLGHDGSVIYLDPRSGTLPTASVDAVQLAAKFVSVETNGVRGLGPAQNGAPLANVRVGFAFYRDASDPSTRYPTTGFEYGLSLDNREIMRQLRDGHYRYVQYDIVFNTLFSPGYVRTDADGRPFFPGNIDTSRKLRPTAPRPTVRELVVPFQF